MEDDQVLAGSLGRQEDQNIQAEEAHKVETQDLGRNHLEADHSLCQIGLEDSSHRKEEDGESLEGRTGRHEEGLGEVDLDGRHSEWLAKVS